MTSFIPIVALFVLVLSNGCFSVPVDAEPNSISTSALIDNRKNEKDTSKVVDTKSGFNKKSFGDSNREELDTKSHSVGCVRFDGACHGPNGSQGDCCPGMHCQKNDPTWAEGRCYYNPGKK